MRVIIPRNPKPYHYNIKPFFVPRIDIAKTKLNRKPKFTDDAIDFLAVKKLYDPNYKPWIKILWLIISVLCVFLCVFQIGFRVYDFVSCPVIFDVKMERQTVFTFPSITLCSGYFINEIIKHVQRNHHQSNHSHGNDTKSSYDSKNFTLSSFWLNRDFVILEEEINISRPCALFSGDKNECEARSASSVMDFEILDTFWGQCLTLTLKDKKFEYRGPFTWISIIWKFPDYVEDNDTLNSVLYFFVHRAGLKLTHDAPFLSNSIHIGYTSNVRISAREFELLNTWNKPCASSEEEVVDCRNECANQLMATKLNCSLPFANISDLPPCDSYENFIKAYKAADSVYNDLGAGDCHHCQQPCEEIAYTISMEGEKKHGFGDGRTEIKLLYADDSREILYEKPSYSMSGLLSEIGGSMGFYLGISVFSLIEMIESLSRYFIFVVNKRKIHVSRY